MVIGGFPVSSQHMFSSTTSQGPAFHPFHVLFSCHCDLLGIEWGASNRIIEFSRSGSCSSPSCSLLTSSGLGPAPTSSESFTRFSSCFKFFLHSCQNGLHQSRLYLSLSGSSIDEVNVAMFTFTLSFQDLRWVLGIGHPQRLLADVSDSSPIFCNHMPLAHRGLNCAMKTPGSSWISFISPFAKDHRWPQPSSSSGSFIGSSSIRSNSESG